MDYLNKEILSTFPVCSFKKGKLVYEVIAYEVSQQFILKEVNKDKFIKLSYKIAELWEQESSKIVQCDACGFIYSIPFKAWGIVNFMSWHLVGTNRHRCFNKRIYEKQEYEKN